MEKTLKFALQEAFLDGLNVRLSDIPILEEEVRNRIADEIKIQELKFAANAPQEVKDAILYVQNYLSDIARGTAK